METLIQSLVELGIFSAKAFIVLIVLVIFAAAIAFLAARSRPHRSQIEIESLNDRFKALQRSLEGHLLDKKSYRELVKADKRERKVRVDQTKKRPRVFVIDFSGDLRALKVQSLRQEITAILNVATPEDEVVVRLESPGGVVPGYGLAAAQLQRLRSRQIPLTVCIDKIAASGGYMMACVANKIIAAPFAIVGSVGVVASVVNVHRILEKNDVDYREVTAGEFKRTVSMFGEITQQGFEKFKAEVQDVHELFKGFVRQNRPHLDVTQISTGEYWYGTRAKELALVDQLQTSDDYLLERTKEADVLQITYHEKRRWTEMLGDSLSETAQTALEKILRAQVWGRFGL